MENQLSKTTNQSERQFLPNILITSIKDIIQNQAKTKSIALLRKENDLELVRTVVSATIMDIFDHYRETYSFEEIKNMNDAIMRIGYMLNGLDFGLFKQKAISGEYKNRVQVIDGRNFDIKFFRLTPDVFLDWLQEYILQRGEAFVNSNIALHKSIQHVSGDTSPKTIELLNKLAESVFKVNIQPEPSPETTYQQKLKELQKFLEKEFVELWKQQGEKEFARGGRYVIYSQISMLLNQYIEQRFKEIFPEGATFTEQKVIKTINKIIHEI